MAVAAAALLASLPVAVAAQSGPSAAPVTSTPVSASEVGETAPENAQGAQGAGLFKVYSFSFLGRPGSVQAGFDRYYWMTAYGLGVRTACTGSLGSAGHCTWAEYYWSRTSTSGGSYLGGNNVPMYFDYLSGTVWLIFAADAPVRSGNWSGRQGGGSATVAISCAVHAEFRTDDWPTDETRDDVWHNVKVCQGSLSDIIEQGGTASIPVAPDEFSIELLTDSDRISRAGRHTKLALRLSRSTGEFVFRGGSEPVPVTSPVANAPLRGTVSAGPSLGAKIMCTVPPRGAVPAPRSSDVCVTDASGRAEVTFAVPASAAHALRRGRDTLSLFVDYDSDGTHDHSPGRVGHEPSATIDIDIAKAINYVALGDSYSSGESGRKEAPGFTGSYITDNAAGEHCRRWSKAYPSVIAEEVLGDSALNIDVSFETFACTGAETINIHHQGDPDNNSAQEHLIESRRPSKHAPAVGKAGWEPRQAVSLETIKDVDLVTVTIGGNDAGFADILTACVLVVTGAGCGDADLPGAFDVVGPRVRLALTAIKNAAPSASVLVLGYPYVTPSLSECPETQPEVISRYERAGDPVVLELAGLSDRCIDAIVRLVEFMEGDDCEPVRANQIYHARPGVQGIIADLLAYSFSSDLNIEASEAVFLKNTADTLNAKIKNAAKNSGVHFVDTSGAYTESRAVFDWSSHSACSETPWIRGFIADKYTSDGKSDASFHPTAEGHRIYAQVLEFYLRGAVRGAKSMLNDAGLPLNPTSTLPVGGASANDRNGNGLWSKPATANAQQNPPGGSP